MQTITAQKSKNLKEKKKEKKGVFLSSEIRNTYVL